MAAAEKKEAEAPAAAAAAPAPGGGGKLVLILTAVNVLATLGMIGILFISFQKDKKKPQVEDIAVQGAEGEAHGEGEGGKEGEHGGGEHGGGGLLRKKTADFGKMVTLEQFTVNLSTPGQVSPKF